MGNPSEATERFVTMREKWPELEKAWGDIFNDENPNDA